MVGTVYLTKQREIGVQIEMSWQGRGFGTEAVKELMKLHPGKFLANINPRNAGSISFFEGLGFNHIQNTYSL